MAAGSHKEGQPKRRFLKDKAGNLIFDKPADDYDLSEFVPLECKVGRPSCYRLSFLCALISTSGQNLGLCLLYG